MATDPQMYIKVAANLSDLRQAMLDAKAEIAGVSDSTKSASSATSGWISILKDLGSSWVARIAEGVLLRDAIHNVIDAVGELATALPEMALKGAAVGDVEENFQRLTAAVGLTGDALMGQLREGTHNTITDFELMKTVNKDLAAGMVLTDQQFGTLAKGAFGLAQATGVDVKSAFDTMNEAMLTGRTRSLAALTGAIDATAAEEKYAASIGVSRENLTDTLKVEALRVATLDAVSAATQRLGVQTDGLDEFVAQAETAWENFTENLGKTIAQSDALNTAIIGVKQILLDAFGGSEQNAIKTIAGAVDQVIVSMVGLGETGVEVAGDVAKEWYGAKNVLGDVRQIIDGVRLAFLMAQQAAALGLLPGSADLGRWRELDDQIAHLELTMKQRGDALQANEKAEAAIDATTAKYVGQLEALRTKVKEAADNQAAFVGPLQAGSQANNDGAAAAAAHAAAVTKLSAADKKYAADLAELSTVGVGWAGTLDTMNGAVVEAIKYYLDAGVAQDKLANVYGLTAVQVKAVASALKDEEAQLKIEQTAVFETAKLWDEYDADRAKNSGTALDAQIAAVDQWAEDLEAKMQKAGADTQGFYEALTAVWTQKLNALSINSAAITKDLSTNTQAGLQQTADKARATYEEALKHVGEFSDGTIQKYRDIADAAQLAADEFGTGFEDNASKATGAINAVTDAAKASYAAMTQMTFRGSANPINDATGQPYTQQEAQRAGYVDMTGIVTPLGSQHGFGNTYGGVNLGARADGGPVAAGQPYIIGERGPELFVPDTAGTVVPNGAAGNVTIQVIVQGSVLSDEKKLAAAVGQAVMNGLRNQGTRLPSGA
jgi:hypothetical protein